MKYDLIKIAEKIKKITKFNILNENAEYLIVGVDLTFKEMAQVGYDNKYCFQPYSAIREKTVPTYFYIMYYDKRKTNFNAPIFLADKCKISNLEQELERFITEISEANK